MACSASYMLLDYMGLPKFVAVADWARAFSLSFIMLVKGLAIVIFVNLDL